MSNYVEYKSLPSNWIKYQPTGDDSIPVPEGLKWSGEDAPPAIGTKIRITINGIGPAIVRGYFSECDWLGLLVDVLSPPDWWVRQNVKPGKPYPRSHVFGVEFKPLKEEASC